MFKSLSFIQIFDKNLIRPLLRIKVMDGAKDLLSVLEIFPPIVFITFSILLCFEISENFYVMRFWYVRSLIWRNIVKVRFKFHCRDSALFRRTGYPSWEGMEMGTGMGTWIINRLRVGTENWALGTYGSGEKSNRAVRVYSPRPFSIVKNNKPQIFYFIPETNFCNIPNQRRSSLASI